jgi:hypothetical protein
MRNDCIDCGERHLGCHSTCERYKLYVEKGNAIKRARFEEAQQNRVSIAHTRSMERKLRGKK